MGKVIAWTTVQHVTNSETRDKVMSDCVSTFDVNIHQRLKDDKYETKDANDPGTRILDLDDDWSNKHTPTSQYPMPDGDIPSPEEYNDPYHTNPIPDADDLEELDNIVGKCLQIQRQRLDSWNCHQTVKRQRGGSCW